MIKDRWLWILRIQIDAATCCTYVGWTRTRDEARERIRALQKVYCGGHATVSRAAPDRTNP
jgi:hypothetical protein